MELNDLKAFWNEDADKLSNRINLNEKVIGEMKLENVVNGFLSFLNVSLWGRNLALVYSLISVVCALFVWHEYQYSIPLLIGAAAMLWSFVHHLSIEEPKDYFKISIVEFQKSICKFRIHTARAKKYDTSIVIVWFLTLLPLCLRKIFGMDVYDNTQYLIALVVLDVVVVVVMVLFSRYIYKVYDRELKAAESHLAEILTFEKTSL
ncbi:hypothetical protein [Chryseolinea lacunae]|uniref:Uncharacterized protein n=1 Tax=Chryseolinea lacunae TaxID=2801331 RepID=A0ABS1KZ17_9BACT|nr:hypothetical protein [Chryseolinea lacunae]MBL0744477.1 hypothetical protein [Chryseolinea lacunae]